MARVLDVGATTVERIRRRFVAEGLAAVLYTRPRMWCRSRKLDGEGEAKLVARTGGSEPPDGRTCGVDPGTAGEPSGRAVRGGLHRPTVCAVET